MTFTMSSSKFNAYPLGLVPAIALLICAGFLTAPAYADNADVGNDVSWLLPKATARPERMQKDPVLYGGSRPADELEQRLIEQAQAGQVKQVKELLAQGARANAQSTSGMRPLHGAVTLGHWEVARLLIRNGADVNATVANGNTPLTIAAQQDDVRMARLLLGSGANLELKNKLGNTPLVTALLLAHDDMAVHLLNAGARIDIKSGDKRCIAELAAAHSGEAVVQRIFDRGGAAACQ